MTTGAGVVLGDQYICFIGWSSFELSRELMDRLVFPTKKSSALTWISTFQGSCLFPLFFMKMELRKTNLRKTNLYTDDMRQLQDY